MVNECVWLFLAILFLSIELRQLFMQASICTSTCQIEDVKYLLCFGLPDLTYMEIPSMYYRLARCISISLKYKLYYTYLLNLMSTSS